jgi:hypothetical protein
MTEVMSVRLGCLIVGLGVGFYIGRFWEWLN